MVAKIKAYKSYAYTDTESEPKNGNDRGKKIVDADPNATFATTKIQKEEPEDSKEEERLFHSHMWVKGFPATVHCWYWEPKEPNFSRGHEAIWFANHSTPAAVHHWVASSRKGSLRQPAVPPSL